jgi:hypothetical protein
MQILKFPERVLLLAAVLGLPVLGASLAQDAQPAAVGAAHAATPSDDAPPVLDSVVPPIYVDSRIGPASCTTYDIATRACGSGTATAYKTLAGAAAAAVAGQTVYIRAGTYTEALVPQRSGTASQPITYQAYTGETATITGADLMPAIDISDRSYLTIDGLTITEVRRWLLAVNSDHDIIRNCEFTRALDQYGSSKTGLFFQYATYNQVVDNLISDSTADNLSLVASDRNLVARNTITEAEHTLWTIKCGNYNILRDNYLYNSRQKIGEIYDCFEVGVDHDITRLNATKYNVVEDNEFAFTPSSGDASPYAGIQYAGQNGIIRRNFFYDTTGPALDMGCGGDEEPYDTYNRIYHNVFCRTDFAGVSFNQSGGTMTDDLFKNNVLYGSIFVRNDQRWSWYIELAGKPIQIMIRERSGFNFEGNDIFNSQAGELYTITYGQRESDSNPPQHSVTWWQSNWPGLFVSNLEVEPLFVDDEQHDYSLQAASPLIDAGVFLTRTVGGGNGATMMVQDAGYFCDGFGVPGETGDRIRLAGTTSTARIVAVDYSTDTLTLDRTLTWSAGQGVSLDFAGTAPDLGAVEYASGLRGDLNCDGVVNNFDITPFVLALTDSASYQATYPDCDIMNGDIDGNGAVNNFDITPFVHLLMSK